VVPDVLERFEFLASGLDHPEGVAWWPAGRLLAGGEAGQIYEIALDGAVSERASTGGFVYGVTVDGGGNVYACDYGNAGVQRVDRRGHVTTYSTGTAERPMRVPNFAAFDDEANLYVTDAGEPSSGSPSRTTVRPADRNRSSTSPARSPTGSRWPRMEPCSSGAIGLIASTGSHPTAGTSRSWPRIPTGS